MKTFPRFSLCSLPASAMSDTPPADAEKGEYPDELCLVHLIMFFFFFFFRHHVAPREGDAVCLFLIV